MYSGRGPIIASTGEALANQPEPIPLFIKQDTNRWEYKGMFLVENSYTEGEEFFGLIEGSGRNPADVSRAIRLIRA
jgi:hypothetical protein